MNFDCNSYKKHIISDNGLKYKIPDGRLRQEGLWSQTDMGLYLSWLCDPAHVLYSLSLVSK